MNKILIALCLVCTTALAQGSCFLAKENQRLLKQEGKDCEQRYAPQSTFKIALSLMGFDSGLLKDEFHPQWPYKKGYETYSNVHKHPQNPHSWIRDSCLWYSQLLTQQLGMKRFKAYVAAFHYGNQDVSGDQGKNNGLTQAWLSSSLAISPAEQVRFIQQIVNKQLPLKPKAFAMTKRLLHIQELPGGWQLYGKTGSARQQGWFVGWIEKNGQVISFADHINDGEENPLPTGFRARNDALAQLYSLINELEK